MSSAVDADVDHRRDEPVLDPETNWITVSGHADDQWRKRTDTDVGPRVAWFYSVRLDVRDDRADVVRYHAPTDTVLIVVDETLVTVFPGYDAAPRFQRAISDLDGVDADVSPHARTAGGELA